MNTALLVVALVSTALAGGLLVYVFRLVREDRMRSDARVAALAERLAQEGVVAAVPASAPARPVEPPAAASSSDEASAALFVQPEAGRGRILLGPAIGTVVVGLVIGAVYLWNAPTAATSQDSGVAAAAEPLELVSLRHERKDATLVVSGLVRNPAGGRRVERAAAVVFLFDKEGAFVASGRAGLDFQQLAPGDESPFVVTLANVGPVARYRVSFRTEAGLVPHVDRRLAGDTAARAAL